MLRGKVALVRRDEGPDRTVRVREEVEERKRGIRKWWRVNCKGEEMMHCMWK